MVYNVPKFTNLNLAVTAVAEMAQHPNIVGIKDSAGNIGQVIDLLRVCPSGFEIMIGNGPTYLSGLQVGASGGVLALANVAPRECVAIRDLVLAGRHAEAREIHFRLMPVGRAVTSGFGVPGLKAGLDLLGYRGGDPRPPLLPADEATRSTMRRILVDAGLLDDGAT
jgi:4-hydroxy-2-oxoglutarate aldolase